MVKPAQQYARNKQQWASTDGTWKYEEAAIHLPLLWEIGTHKEKLF
jgi:hypothetical protein